MACHTAKFNFSYTVFSCLPVAHEKAQKPITGAPLSEYTGIFEYYSRPFKASVKLKSPIKSSVIFRLRFDWSAQKRVAPVCATIMFIKLSTGNLRVHQLMLFYGLCKSGTTGNFHDDRIKIALHHYILVPVSWK